MRHVGSVRQFVAILITSSNFDEARVLLIYSAISEYGMKGALGRSVRSNRGEAKKSPKRWSPSMFHLALLDRFFDFYYLDVFKVEGGCVYVELFEIQC